MFYNLPFSTIFEDLLLSVKVQPSKFDPPMLSRDSVTFLTSSFPVNSKDILLIGTKDSNSSSHETMSNGYQKKSIAHLYFCRMRRTVKKVPDSYKYNLVWCEYSTHENHTNHTTSNSRVLSIPSTFA